MTTKQKAVFLDRDGTIIADAHYPHDANQVRLLPGAAQALAEIRDLGLLLVLISNQSGIGRGLLTTGQAELVHRRMEELLHLRGVQLDAAYYCPHRPDDGCRCRKPAPGLILQASADLAIDLAGSFMIGDKLSDLEAGQRAGCTALLLTHASRSAPDESLGDDASNWPGLIEIIKFALAGATPKA